MFPWHRVLVAVCAALFLVLLSTPASAAARPAEVWAACGQSSPPEKVVRVFPRAAPIGVGPPAGPSPLQCGTDRFGYRHIADKHGPDWQALALYTGENWRDMADFAITQILAAPQPGYPQFNDKANSWTFKAPLEIKDDRGTLRDTYWPIVAVAAQDGKILTSYPTRDPR